MTNELAIDVQGLVVRYGRALGLRGLDLSVKRGQVCGLVGPNGAGKSTAMRVLCALQDVEEGRVEVLGFDAREKPSQVRWNVGFMPDVLHLPESVSVMDFLEYVAGIHALPTASTPAAIDQVLELTDLVDHRDKLLGALSKGMRQRLWLARTLLPEPELLILDEPASGLDPRARVDFRSFIRELQGMNRTVLISSHVLSDLSEICDSLAIVEQGRTVVQGTLEEIRASFGPGLEVAIEAIEDVEAFEAALIGMEAVSGLSVDGQWLRFSFDGSRRELAEMLRDLAASGRLFCNVETGRADVEDLFLRLTRGVVS